MWDYAALSKLAAQYGGPEQLLRLLRSTYLEQGGKLMLAKMKPFLIGGPIGGVVIGSLATAGVIYYLINREKLVLIDKNKLEVVYHVGDTLSEEEVKIAEKILVEDMELAEQVKHAEKTTDEVDAEE